MEFSQEISSSVVIKPSELDQLQKNIIKTLILNVKGRCLENVGYINDIGEILEVIGEKINGRYGNVKYIVRYIAKVIQPKIGEIIEATVSTLMNDTLYATNGPVQVCARLPPTAKGVYEHHTCNFRIEEYRHDEDQIWCVGELIV